MNISTFAPSTVAAKLLVVIVVCGSFYVYGRHDGQKLALADELRDAEVARMAIDAAQRGAAQEIAKLEIKHVTVQQKIERETHEVPVYRDCRHSPDGLLGLNALLENRAEPAGDRELPGNAGPAAGR